MPQDNEFHDSLTAALMEGFYTLPSGGYNADGSERVLLYHMDDTYPYTQQTFQSDAHAMRFVVGQGRRDRSRLEHAKTTARFGMHWRRANG